MRLNKGYILFRNVHINRKEREKNQRRFDLNPHENIIGTFIYFS